MHLYNLFFLSLTILFSACSAPEKEDEGEIMEYTESAEAEEESKEIVEEEAYEDFEGVQSKHVMFCRIGTYQEAAIMVLDWGEMGEYTYPITGYYFYVKHQKMLDLEGFSDPKTRGIYLTESYKGKETGYMEFAQDAHIQPWDHENFWAPSKDSKEKQEFYSEDILFIDPMEANLALQYDQYKDEHGITMYMGEEEGEVEEYVTDELNWVIVNDEFFAFDIHVTGRNGHTGSASGYTKVIGDEAVWIAPDDEDGCTLTFDLSDKENKIHVEEENCTFYHGFHASFTSTFSK